MQQRNPYRFVGSRRPKRATSGSKVASRQIPRWKLKSSALAAVVIMFIVSYGYSLLSPTTAYDLVQEDSVSFVGGGGTFFARYPRDRLMIYSHNAATVCQASTTTGTVLASKPHFLDSTDIDSIKYYPVAIFGGERIEIKAGNLHCSGTETIAITKNRIGDAGKPIVIGLGIVAFFALLFGVPNIINTYRSEHIKTK